MNKLAAAVVVALAFAAPAAAQGLPDLGGRTIRAVTENAYTPLNFADPRTGGRHRLGIRCDERDRETSQRQGRVEPASPGT